MWHLHLPGWAVHSLAVLLSCVVVFAMAGMQATFVVAAQPVICKVLDTSGSLGGPGGTDPNRWGSAVVEAGVSAIDVGSLAVVLMGGDQARMLGPVDASDRAAKRRLIDEVAAAPAAGWTPMAGAVEQCVQLIADAGWPAGSEIWLLTDGKPEPGTADQVARLRRVVTSLRARAVPIHTIAFAGTPAEGKQLLAELADGTGGAAREATNLTDLTRLVLENVARRSDLAFSRPTERTVRAGGVAVPLVVPPGTSAVTVLGFRASPGTTVDLVDPGNRRLSTGGTVRVDGVPNLVWFDLTSPAAGTYTVQATGAPGPLVVYQFSRGGVTLDLVEPGPNERLAVGREALLKVGARAQDGSVLGAAGTQLQIEAQVVTPAGTTLPVPLESKGSGSFAGRFTPELSGVHTLAVRVAGDPSSMSRAFTFRAVALPSLVITGERGRTATVLPGSPVSWNVGMESGGQRLPLAGQDLQFEVLGPDGAPVPQELVRQEMGKDGARVTVFPATAGGYALRARAAGAVESTPYEIEAAAAETVVTLGRSIEWTDAPTSVAVKEGSPVRLRALARLPEAAGWPFKLGARLTGPGGESLPAPDVRRTSLGDDIVVQFTAPDSGRYTVWLEVVGGPARPVVETTPSSVDVLVIPLSVWDRLQPVLPYAEGIASGTLLLVAVVAASNKRRYERVRATQTLAGADGSRHRVGSLIAQAPLVSKLIGRPTGTLPDGTLVQLRGEELYVAAGRGRLGCRRWVRATPGATVRTDDGKTYIVGTAAGQVGKSAAPALDNNPFLQQPTPSPFADGQRLPAMLQPAGGRRIAPLVRLALRVLRHGPSN